MLEQMCSARQPEARPWMNFFVLSFWSEERWRRGWRKVTLSDNVSEASVAAVLNQHHLLPDM